MLKFLVIIYILTNSLVTIAQKSVDTIDNAVEIINEKENDIQICINTIQSQPVYKRGKKQLFLDIIQNANYPKTALNDSIEGKVFIGFTIDTLGKIIKPRVVKGIRADLDLEALKTIKALGDWIPATQQGNKIAVKYVLPVNFKLNN